MNRQQALEWCVENVTKWENSEVLHNVLDVKKRWGFYLIGSQYRMFNVSNQYDSPITKQDWLDAKAKKGQPYTPQVGEECEYDSKGSAKIEIFDFDFDKHCIVDLWADGDQIEVIAHSEQCGNFVLVVKNKTAKINNFSAILPEYVRPLKTERKELIEIIDSCNMSSGTLANAILDAGYRKSE